MSQVVYNNVSLGHIQTQEISEAPEMDPSGSDHLYNVIRIRLTSLITGFVPGPNYLPPAAPGEATAVAVARRIKHELSLPRRPFLYRVGGVTLFDLPAGRDDTTGPIPFGVTVTEVTAGCFVINWGVEIRLSECPNRGTGPVPLVLLNRWKETATINDRWLTTKRRQGRLVLSGRSGEKPDHYRDICTPSIEPGFVRKTAEYALSENGLEVAYLFVDEEQAVMPPVPAIKASGRQVESAAMPGAVRYGQIDLRLEGPKGVKKEDLLKAAVRIGMSRALAGGLKKVGTKDGQGGSYLIGGAVVEDLFDNAIELSMRWLVQADQRRVVREDNVFGAMVRANFIVPDLIAGAVLGQRPLAFPPAEPAPPDEPKDPKAGLTTPKDWVGKDLPGVKPDRALAPPTRGTAETLGLVAALLKDPCLQETLKPGELIGEDKKMTNELTTVTQKAKVFSVPALPPPEKEDESALYDDETPGAYDHFDIVCHYTQDEGKVLLASTGQVSLAGTGQYEMLPHPVAQLHNPTLKLTVEMTAKRTGGPPVLPDPKDVPRITLQSGKQINDPVYMGGTISPAGIDLAADGVTTVHTVSAVFRYEYQMPCAANIISPLPPFLKTDLKKDARLAASVVSGDVLFFRPPDVPVTNLFCDKGIKHLGEAELVSVPFSLPRPS